MVEVGLERCEATARMEEESEKKEQRNAGAGAPTRCTLPIPSQHAHCMCDTLPEPRGTSGEAEPRLRKKKKRKKLRSHLSFMCQGAGQAAPSPACAATDDAGVGPCCWRRQGLELREGSAARASSFCSQANKKKDE